MKKKLYTQNPHVALYALQVLESCVKNCGTPFHQEVAAKPFLEELRELIKTTTNENVRNKILELIQSWAYAFRNEPNYRAVQDTVNLIKMDGFKFPTVKESDAMFSADTAPDWTDGDCCNRCRVQFTVVQRKHHCRNCGQIFCGKCSSKTSAIPRFGIEKEVRVCEACWEKLKVASSPGEKSSNSNSEQSSSQATTGNEKSVQELQEEEELQLAIALSKSEAENQQKGRGRLTSTTKSDQSNQPYSYGDIKSVENKKQNLNDLEQDPELAQYLNRAYWEQRQQEGMPQTSPIPSAPASVNTTQSSVPFSLSKVTEKFQNGEVDELDGFQNSLRTTLEIFVNRMKIDSSRGRHIANDTYVQSLFMNITNMHAQLLKYIQEQDDVRARYETLQDKLTQVRDARAALDALREDHQERLRLVAEEAERQRQYQMAQKLEIMRKKKQEYLQFQREVAMQRMHEQEREMQMRQEQQKQQYQTIHQGPPLPPSVYPPSQGPYLPGPGYPVPLLSQPPENDSLGVVQYPGQYGQPPMSPSTNQQPVYPPYNIQAVRGSLPTASQGNMYSAAFPVIPTPVSTIHMGPPPPHQVGQVAPPGHFPLPVSVSNQTMSQSQQHPGVAALPVMENNRMALPLEQPSQHQPKEAELISFD
ncbi:hepatocyte growth factor-regulated tyrosine kinase substrate-like isoform X2 [Limulus polyphemus]|uniref:Hepatocyte growth factor-regulated tyrosine kinase substrate n=1 Tax=Limulus polyphemus TaxID=6850 RepID=A0ABM1BVH3_LIMPO|nr:hepatocyte growth factor-regulated tyrosine kinase substrate-like isoform X2 [Limulus polyphemus]